jgi:hypothetical protein
LQNKDLWRAYYKSLYIKVISGKGHIEGIAMPEEGHREYKLGAKDWGLGIRGKGRTTRRYGYKAIGK